MQTGAKNIEIAVMTDDKKVRVSLWIHLILRARQLSNMFDSFITSNPSFQFTSIQNLEIEEVEEIVAEIEKEKEEEAEKKKKPTSSA